MGSDVDTTRRCSGRSTRGGGGGGAVSRSPGRMALWCHSATSRRCSRSLGGAFSGGITGRKDADCWLSMHRTSTHSSTGFTKYLAAHEAEAKVDDDINSRTKYRGGSDFTMHITTCVIFMASVHHEHERHLQKVLVDGCTPRAACLLQFYYCLRTVQLQLGQSIPGSRKWHPVADSAIGVSGQTLHAETPG